MDDIRPWLCIGKFSETMNANLLKANGVQAMLQLADPVEQEGIASLYLPMQDMSATPHDLIREGVEFILREKAKRHKILVACGAGINRSTMFCVAALKETEGVSLLEAFEIIKEKRFSAMPHEPVWYSFCLYYTEEIPYVEVRRVGLLHY